MPLTPKAEHRAATPSGYDGLVMVARTVGKREIRSTPKAQAALRKEWDSLRRIKAWDESKVREWRSVQQEARDRGGESPRGNGLCHLRGNR